MVGTDGLDGAGRRARFDASPEVFRWLQNLRLEVPLVCEDLERGLRVEKRCSLTRATGRVTYRVDNRGSAPDPSPFTDSSGSPACAEQASNWALDLRGRCLHDSGIAVEKLISMILMKALFPEPVRWLAPLLRRYFLTMGTIDGTKHYAGGQALGDGTYVAGFAASGDRTPGQP